MRGAQARCYVRRMRVKRSDLDTALDVGFAVVGVGLTAVATMVPEGLLGTAVTVPPGSLAVLPLLIGGPLVLRRRAPLLMWVICGWVYALQALATHQPPGVPSWSFVLCAGSYALAAHASLRRALAGLAVAVPGLTIYTVASHQRRWGW